MSYEYVSDQHAITNCRQCGYTYQFNRRYLSGDRDDIWWLCKSCKAKPATICWYGDDWCRPWQGDFDVDMLICLDENGRPVHLGARSCGHWDCVRRDHLVS